MTARYTEMDYNGHINMMWYGVWMEEARCVAAAAGATLKRALVPS